MTDDTKIMLENMTTGSLSVNIPDLRYKRRWEKAPRSLCLGECLKKLFMTPALSI